MGKSKPSPWDVPDKALGFKLLVTMGDVDAYQVYFAAYYRWMDLGFHLLIQNAGMSMKDLLAAGIAMPAVHSECDYFKPVNIDQILECRVWVGSFGRSSFSVKAVFKDKDSDVVAQGEVVHVYVENGKPCRIPKWLEDICEYGNVSVGGENHL